MMSSRVPLTKKATRSISPGEKRLDSLVVLGTVDELQESHIIKMDCEAWTFFEIL